MSTADEQTVVDICSGPGIPAAAADAARNECLATKRGEGKSVAFLAHNSATRAATNQFLQVCKFITC
jgi:hypothetical protein